MWQIYGQITLISLTSDRDNTFQMVFDVSMNTSLRQQKPSYAQRLKNTPPVPLSKKPNFEEEKKPIVKAPVDLDDLRLRQEREARIVQTETSKYYQDLIPNSVIRYRS